MHTHQKVAAHVYGDCIIYEGGILQVDVVEDESTGKRTIKTTTICWGNKLSLLVSTPFYDPRLPANPNDPDLDFSQAQTELNTEADWQKVRGVWHCHFIQISPADPTTANSVVSLASIQMHCCACTSHTMHACAHAMSRRLQSVHSSCKHLCKQLRLKTELS